MKPHLARGRSAGPRRRGVPVTTSAVVGTLLLVAATLAACSSSSPSVSGPLATYHADNARTGYSTDTSITTANATGLTQQWSVKETAAISAQAIVTDGVAYWGDWNGIEHATTTTGKQLWATSIGIAPKPKACPFKLGPIGVVSSATVGGIGGKKALWVGGGNGSLYALDATTGAVIWRTQLGDPPLHVLWSSPVFYNGSIYEGVASWNDCPVVNGGFYRVNASTGAVQTVSHLSQQASCVGPSLWSSASVDPSDNSIYVSTSNANQRSNPDNTCTLPDADAVLKLDASTLAQKSVWQVPLAQQVADSDFGGSPMLFSATIGGVNRQLVGAVNKNGVYYALDRTNLAAGPEWTYTAEDAATAQAAGLNDPCADRNTISTSAWAGTGSPVIVAGVALNGSSCIGTVAALDAATGRPIWQVPVGGIVQGAVTEVPGLVAVGAGPFLQVLSSSTGASLFTYHEPAGSDTGNGQGQNHFFWPPPTIAGTKLIIGNEDGYFRAFGL
jgi:polyvinyl alcohol dehydrogenase (cytochrome)